jgi:hypothetical protein
VTLGGDVLGHTPLPPTDVVSGRSTVRLARHGQATADE